MPPDPASKLNRSAWQAGFTYTMVLDVVKIQDTGQGEKSVDDDLEAVLKKIENWHQGSIAGCRVGFGDAQGARRRIEWDGEEPRVCRP